MFLKHARCLEYIINANCDTILLDVIVVEVCYIGIWAVSLLRVDSVRFGVAARYLVNLFENNILSLYVIVARTVSTYYPINVLTIV